MEEVKKGQSTKGEMVGKSSPKKIIMVLVVIICILISSSLLIYFWLNVEEEEHWVNGYYYKWRINDNGDWEVRVISSKDMRLEDMQLQFIVQATGTTSYSKLNSSGVNVGPVSFLNNGNSEDLLDNEDTFIINRKEVSDGDYMKLIYIPTGFIYFNIAFPME